MIKFFRKIRKKLLAEGNVGKYLKYAVGEIVLVVIGILIALQINNWNENRKTKNIEHIYLENIKADLKLNLTSLKIFIADREKSIKSSDSILEFFNKTKVFDVVAFNRQGLNVMIWYPFEQHNNTYQELLNSGNLSIISNKAIKDSIQNMQASFKKIAFIENEMQQDFESYLYDPFFTTIDLETSLKGLENEKIKLDSIQANLLLNNMVYKNGFILSAFNSESLITEYSKILKTTNQLILLINSELNQ
ncbi:hypothetical protein SAMN05421824_1080 [Hyunsoonleella jejuensis]|uniref:Uncharacterized protein n=1 Tax=Hyunsoonleella jejuensis TaxID=419940 RepID=A0A1H9D0W6_9FLAO|nr:DUF6090 family protein [Hyunsoonleella jejuensis]SEQ07110.1 hypothetical protein SAMN05421824_1080 [Hyunsoonleella jejuensis]